MQLVVRDRVINEDPIKILDDIKFSCHNGKLDQYKLSGSGIAVTCPHHSGGMERRPSCYINLTNTDVPYMFYHCFTCGSAGPFSKFVGECFNRDEEFGENWLIANYASDYVKRDLILPKITLNNKQGEKYLDESILDSFESYHPYMTKRKISDDVISRFKIKFDPKTQCIVFPVRDIKGRLRFLTRRSVEGKKFIIDDLANKKYIYLLDEVVKNNYKTVIITESQINALTCWSWGYPAVALIGAGTTKEQMEVLNGTGINHYILAYDGDYAGRCGEQRFLKFIRKDVFVDIIRLPDGKDINDLEKEEFEKFISDFILEFKGEN